MPVPWPTEPCPLLIRYSGNMYSILCAGRLYDFGDTHLPWELLPQESQLIW